MDLTKIVDNIAEKEIEKYRKQIVDLVRKEVETYISSAEFKLSLREEVKDNIHSMLEDDGPLYLLPNKEVDGILRKAVRSVIKA